MTKLSIIKYVFVTTHLLLLMSGCGVIATKNDVVTVIKIMTKGDDIEIAQPKSVQVSNCNGFPDYITEACTAGTESSFSLAVGEINLFFDPSISKEFSFSKGNTQSLSLEPPPDGFIYQYLVTTTYTIITGKALIQSSDGEQETVQYRYQATCSISKNVPELYSCPGTVKPTDTTTQLPISTETLMAFPTSTPLPLGTTIKDLVWLRRGPGEHYEAITTYGRGVILTIQNKSEDGKWLVVLGPDGSQGWVSSESLQMDVSMTSIPDATPPPTQTPKPTTPPGPGGRDYPSGDINRDCIVDNADVAIVQGAYGTNDSDADLNGDGLVNLFDYNIVLTHFGEICP